MVKEASIPDKDKKTRILECLLPPALGIARKLPDTATPSLLLSSLSKVYGAACDGADLYSIFRDTHQEPSEIPSAYLSRLELQLDQIVQYGGMNASQVDSARINQFIRGCVYDETLVNALQLRQKRSNPPDYLTFLSEVRTEEAAQLARVKMRQQTKVGVKAHQAPVQAPPQCSPDDSLRKEVAELKDLVRQLALAASTPTPVVPAATASHPPQQSGQNGQRRRNRGPILCFNCGEYGHMKNDCRNPVNAVLVQQRLSTKFGQGNAPGHQRRSTQVPNQY
jgi:hypothetical protein